MANPSDPKHINWNRGEYRSEYLSHEDDPEFNRGLLAGINVDLHPTNVIYRRGGFVKVANGLDDKSLVETVTKDSTDYTYVNDSYSKITGQATSITYNFVGIFFKDWHVAELFTQGSTTWFGVVAALTEGSRIGPAGAQIPELPLLSFSMIPVRTGENLRDKWLTRQQNYFHSTRVGLLGDRNGRAWLVGDNFVPETTGPDKFSDVISEMSVFRGTASALEKVTSTGARIERLTEERFAFVPPSIDGMNVPIYTAVKSSVGLWDMKPLGADKLFLWSNVAEFGFYAPERLDRGVTFQVVPAVVARTPRSSRVVAFSKRGTSDPFTSQLFTGMPGETSVKVGYVSLATPSSGTGGYEVTTTDVFSGVSPEDLRDMGRDPDFGNIFSEALWDIRMMEGPEQLFLNSTMVGDNIQAESFLREGSPDTHNTKDTWWVRAKVSEEFLRKTIQMDGFGGICLTFLGGASGIDGRYFLTRVVRGAGWKAMQADASDTSNCWLGFYLASKDELAELKARNAEDKHYKFKDLTEMAKVLYNQTSINTFAFPYWTKEAGNFKHLGRVSGRVCLSNPDANLVAYSATGISTLFTSFVPNQFALGTDELRSVADTRVGTLATQPDSRASFDELAFYQMQVVGAIGDGVGFLPYYNRLTLDDDAVPYWVSGQEGAIMGTGSGELAVGNLLAGATNYNSYVSNRGSSSSLIAKGDSSIYFVGPGGRELYQVFFRRNRSGMVTRHMTREGGGFLQEGIKDMKWDFQRKALWVIYGEGKVALYFSDVEYELGGWVRYGFGKSEIFGARSLVRFVDKTVGVIRTDNRIYRCPVPYHETYKKFTDDTEDEADSGYRSKVVFPVTAPGGSNYTKRLREVVLKTKGATRLLMGGDTVPKSTTGTGVDEATWAVTPYIDDDVKGFRIPSLEVVHEEDERMLFLSLGGTVEVNVR